MAEEETPETVALAKIDLPPTPLALSSEDVAHGGARVSIYLLDKSKHVGWLEWFNSSQQLVVLRTQLADGEYEFSQTTFSNIARIIFSESMLLAKDDDNPFSIRSLVNTTEEQNYVITLVNGEVIKGNLLKYIEDEYGLHLFQTISGNRLVRMFVPKASIDKHTIGEPLGQTLLKKNTIKEPDLNEGLEKQKVLRSKKLGEYLTQNSVIGHEQLEGALAKQKEHPDKKLGQILLEEELVTNKQLNEALSKQYQDHSRLLGSILEEMDIISEDDIAGVMAEKYGIPIINLRQFDIDPSALALIPLSIAKKHKLIPLCFLNNRLAIASRAVLDTELVNTIYLLTGYKIEVFVAPGEEISWAIDHYYPSEKQYVYAITSTIETRTNPEIPPPLAERANNKTYDKPSIERLLKNIISESHTRHASDIHFIPGHEDFNLSYRIDGEIQKIRSLSISIHEPLVGYIKELSRMDAKLTNTPQEGLCRIETDGHSVSLRVSIIPSIFGDSIALRIWNTNLETISLDTIGLEQSDQKIIEKLIEKSSALILVTGPNGSGITSSLYSLINMIKQKPLNAITIEHPVEQHMTGIEQLQVDVAKGFTYPIALQSIINHDPDVIMLGDIPDKECAKIAFDIAHDGHIIFGGMHMRSAVETLTRLHDMGIEKYILQSTSLAILSQRLIRKICINCIKPESPDSKFRELLQLDETETFYKGSGCGMCAGTGYSGRLLIYELLENNKVISEQLTASSHPDRIQMAVSDSDMVSLIDHALAKARSRLTSLDEVYKIYTSYTI